MKNLQIQPTFVCVYGQTVSAVQQVQWTTLADRTLEPEPASVNQDLLGTIVTPVLQVSMDSTAEVRMKQLKHLQVQC